jgi:hypothetical protein
VVAAVAEVVAAAVVEVAVVVDTGSSQSNHR